MVTTSAIAPVTATTAAASTTPTTTSVIGQKTIANNFNTFLELLTTQLKNQNPLDPLDTNQFTQQLVQFAQVEQQMNMNSSLGTLVSLQKSTQTSVALGFLGSTVVVNGDTAQLTAGKATWNFSSDKPATATINVKNQTGEVVYSEQRTVSAGAQSFTWNGLGSNGQAMPDGDYTISVAAKDASGQVTAIATEVEGVVDAVDLNQALPLLSIGSRTFTLDKIKQVRHAAK
jgi:flagellar basal-body rod modification protein FlgD